MVSEFCNGPSLEKKIKQCGKVEQGIAIDWMKQMVYFRLKDRCGRVYSLLKNNSQRYQTCEYFIS